MNNHITVIYDTLQTIRNTRRAVKRSGDFPIQLAALRTIEHRAQALLRALQEQQFDESNHYQNHDFSGTTRRAAAVEEGRKIPRARRRAVAQKSGCSRHRTNRKRWSR